MGDVQYAWDFAAIAFSLRVWNWVGVRPWRRVVGSSLVLVIMCGWSGGEGGCVGEAYVEVGYDVTLGLGWVEDKRGCV
jgi:hypothetical protein